MESAMSSIGSRVRAAVLALGLLVVGTKASALLISADFGYGFAGGSQPLFSGVEPKAAALDPAFGAADVWNDLTTGDAGLVTDPSWSSLLDATGAVTGVTLAITGTLDSYNGVSPTASSLTRESTVNASLGVSTTLSWSLSGLTPGGRATRSSSTGANTDVNRGFGLTIDGVGLVGAVPTASGVDPEPLYVVVAASAGGVISGHCGRRPGLRGGLGRLSARERSGAGDAAPRRERTRRPRGLGEEARGVGRPGLWRAGSVHGRQSARADCTACLERTTS